MSLDDVKFAGTGAWGAGLGRPLTRAEADGNLYAIREVVQGILDDPTPGVGIANISVSGRQFTVHLTDSSTMGPFDMPMVNPRFRGVWAASINYAAYDIVRVGGFGTYMVVQDHTSASTFDPYVGNSAGNYYIQIGPDPFYTAQYVNVIGSTLTLDLSYQNKYIRATNATSLAVTLNAGIFPSNAEIHFRQASTGPITLTAGVGVTLNVPLGFEAETVNPGDVFTIKHMLGDEWDIFGKLSEVSV